MYIYTIQKWNLHLALKQVRLTSMTIPPLENQSNLKFTYNASKCYKYNLKIFQPSNKHKFATYKFTLQTKHDIPILVQTQQNRMTYFILPQPMTFQSV
jgi:hypothetical protein